jgi:hypothetical protein
MQSCELSPALLWRQAQSDETLFAPRQSDSVRKPGRKSRKLAIFGVILWPAEYKTGNMVYPYSEARKN